jgi:hypothetical protein
MVSWGKRFARSSAKRVASADSPVNAKATVAKDTTSFPRIAPERLEGKRLRMDMIEKLHGNELLAVLRPNVVNGADVRVIQRRSGLCFAAETFHTTPTPPPPSFSTMR